jgi:2-oxoglutarate ferredoxin oxidoreductase subunit alpha
MRIRSLPFSDEVGDFIQSHSRNYVIELNRDGQLHQILINEFCDKTNRLISLAHLDGLPITATRVINAVTNKENERNG